MDISVMAVFDMIGTIAFAIVGALVGVQKRLDIFGVAILALATAVGGGIVRDVVIGNTPPAAFRNSVFVLVSLVSAGVVMLIHHQFKRFTMVLQICDAIGLGAFAAGGANLAVEAGYYNILTVTFLAVVTAVGGGVIRDVFAQEIPAVFCKEIYATAALAGALFFYFIYPYVVPATAMYGCFSITTGLRLLALHYNWDLPQAR
ncbi:MAG: trimeric intracellular cation channel family protein [Selenomonadaceae bacterium]